MSLADWFEQGVKFCLKPARLMSKFFARLQGTPFLLFHLQFSNAEALKVKIDIIETKSNFIIFI